MPEPLTLRIFEGDAVAFAAELTGPVELGRQRTGEPDPYADLPAGPGGPRRVVIARLREDSVSRQHAVVEPLPGGKVRLTNTSRVVLGCSESPLTPGESREVAPPVSLRIGMRRFTVGDPAGAPQPRMIACLHEFSEATLAPGSGSSALTPRPAPHLSDDQIDAFVSWLRPTLNVLESTIAADDFLAEAAAALVTVVGLYHGRALLLEAGEWRTAAQHSTPGLGPAGEPSRHVLDQMRRHRRTVWQTPDAGDPSASLQAIEAVIASPILDRSGEVVGALYGDRTRRGVVPRPITKLEAMLVELLASGVATGLARVRQESVAESALSQAQSARTQFERFFTRELAEELASEPGLLEGRDAEVSLLFCDIRGFSRIAERLGPAVTVKWVSDVMTELSECVLAESGLVVDYIGDELIAMWGAPRPQPEHAARAVRAALAMIDRLKPLSERWKATLGEPVKVGIGINTGVARVGNVGSRYKFKYGPLGNTVNLASRVQGATKYLKCDLLVTAATRDRLPAAEFVSRRVSRVRVANIAGAVDLCEVERAGDTARGEFFHESEAALHALEGGDPLLAARLASQLLLEHPKDGPLLSTLARASAALMNEPGEFDPVWALPGK